MDNSLSEALAKPKRESNINHQLGKFDQEIETLYQSVKRLENMADRLEPQIEEDAECCEESISPTGLIERLNDKSNTFGTLNLRIDSVISRLEESI